ncbi:Piso0_002795 [Millerozyma farinosa CBS 7064]|uniref:Piso0_002795 protein n=1 Tax=Pichia sorbitophila (strain ATCC MYA-4447 / BCRC 22081 / CBS 7064 / NBRC 10061 / NRRL Y-12695) TaxID=559304 RepID=G8YDJ0_PICSO|nr:Piso0_002795 [Millerozyma farinosa CBS 7064]
MDWYNSSQAKRGSVSAGTPYLKNGIRQGISPQRSQYYRNTGAMGIPGINHGVESGVDGAISSVSERPSYYFSQYPLYCCDWISTNAADVDCIALGTYKEGFTNKLEIAHGVPYGRDAILGTRSDGNEDLKMASPTLDANDSVEGFDFHKVSEFKLDYPITRIQWDPQMLRSSPGCGERLAVSSEVLRLFKVEQDYCGPGNEYNTTQTHILANTMATGNPGAGSHNTVSPGGNGNLASADELDSHPPVTSFDWNKVDTNIIITSSVDTTCTVWDLNRSSRLGDGLACNNNATSAAPDTAYVKTQLIAHDSEVFDVKFIHGSTNIFASVGNDGSMRVFDLRSLEHSTIIYEPSSASAASGVSVGVAAGGASSLTASPSSAAASDAQAHSSKALLKLATSNIDQHYLATIMCNSNQVLIVDMRMPGVPVATLDGSFGGLSPAAFNSISWHPSSNHLLTAGDDCQALIWDCTHLDSSMSRRAPASMGLNLSPSLHYDPSTMQLPSFAYSEDLEVNNACWRADSGDWIGVVSGKGFQAVSL